MLPALSHSLSKGFHFDVSGRGGLARARGRAASAERERERAESEQGPSEKYSPVQSPGFGQLAVQLCNCTSLVEVFLALAGVTHSWDSDTLLDSHVAFQARGRQAGHKLPLKRGSTCLNGETRSHRMVKPW